MNSLITHLRKLVVEARPYRKKGLYWLISKDMQAQLKSLATIKNKEDLPESLMGFPIVWDEATTTTKGNIILHPRHYVGVIKRVK